METFLHIHARILKKGVIPWHIVPYACFYISGRQSGKGAPFKHHANVIMLRPYATDPIYKNRENCDI